MESGANPPDLSSGTEITQSRSSMMYTVCTIVGFALIFYGCKQLLFNSISKKEIFFKDHMKWWTILELNIISNFVAFLDMCGILMNKQYLRFLN